MTTQNATVAPPTLTQAARRYSEQIHALVDRPTREYTLGLAILAARADGYTRPKEGEAIRELLAGAIGAAYRKDPDAYEAAVLAGRAELEARAAERSADTAADPQA